MHRIDVNSSGAPPVVHSPHMIGEILAEASRASVEYPQLIRSSDRGHHINPAFVKLWPEGFIAFDRVL